MKVYPRLVSLLTLLGSFFAVTPAIGSAAPTVEEAVMGPATAGGIYVVSPSGGRIAYMGMKGARLVVVVDGVEGPLFDELYSSQGQSFYAPAQAGVHPSVSAGQQPGAFAPVLFTADGAHYAYAGRQGNDYVVIHDGREVARVPRERST
ncbi:MAG TPA: hypothetical protein VHF69_00965, partial [Candidatus Synoicihabitans sp.]|nr:hypothetical protein [Candidatus Synoicihabitans sp.]